MGHCSGDLVAGSGVWTDPLWRVRVELLPVERELLRTWWVRRLAHVAHAGAAAWTTVQAYSRLEHSLGVLALTAHFAPDDALARSAALLHDIGHLPLSHTFEHAGGFHHHDLGDERLAELAPVLARHGLDAEEVARHQHEGSAARRSAGLLGLDHLDSFGRSGQVNGWAVEPAARLLERLRLVDGVIDTDARTAELLAGYAVNEAASQCAASNVVAYAVVERIARTLLAGAGAAARARIAAMTDVEFWALALADPRTQGDAEALRRRPDSWRIRLLRRAERAPEGAMEFVKHRLYTVLPTTEGRPSRTQAFADLPPVPIRWAVEERSARAVA
ncbi:HD domain-containing protein [Amnibacterium endophyticum]|uniref:HD domain-containing protein n=1 Tax=Amnibacterium endophyticum TaxID=2109337 RepID=A0ABW4LEV8_9MICO